MAKITTITNPLTGQPAQVDQLDHTAQQIDGAVSRALPGGAIDLALSTKPGAWLNDNGVFLPGCLVDQRQGRVVKPNTTYYSDNQLTTSAGTTSAYVKAYRYATGTASGVSYASFKLTDTDDAPTYYAAPENVVRGYTGIVHGPDRWKLLNSQCAVTIDNGGITLHRNGGDIWIFAKTLEPELVSTLTGKFVIISVMTDAGLVEFPVSSAFTAEQSVVSTSGTCIWLSAAGHLFLGTTADSVKLKGAKLELGDTQTLAHQDTNGNWQLNELPNYADTLSRCQRSCFTTLAYHYFSGAIYGTGSGIFFIPTPTTLRATPVISVVNPGSIIDKNGYRANLTADNFNVQTKDDAGIKMQLINLPDNLAVGPCTICDFAAKFYADL